MKKIIFCISLVFSSSILFGQTLANDIIGVWETVEKDAKMKVIKSDNEYIATLLWGKDIVNVDGTSKKDSNNLDEELRNRDLIGITYIKGLQFHDEEWNNGTVYNNSNGKWYKCYVWMENEQLHLRGYLGLPILGQTSKWNRTK